MSIERYLLFTKFMMQTVFSHMYVDPILQQYRRAMSGRAGNRDGGSCFQKIANSWLSAFIYIYRVLKNVFNFSGMIEEVKKNTIFLAKLSLMHRFAATWSYG